MRIHSFPSTPFCSGCAAMSAAPAAALAAVGQPYALLHHCHPLPAATGFTGFAHFHSLFP